MPLELRCLDSADKTAITTCQGNAECRVFKIGSYGMFECKFCLDCLWLNCITTLGLFVGCSCACGRTQNFTNVNQARLSSPRKDFKPSTDAPSLARSSWEYCRIRRMCCHFCFGLRLAEPSAHQADPHAPIVTAY